MGLIEDTPRIRRALAEARGGEAARIVEAVQAHRVVGILGEAEVGKTETIRQALVVSGKSRIVPIDLDGAASDDHVGFLLAKRIARALVGDTDFSLLSGGALLPSRIEGVRLRLAGLLGVDGLEEAMREWPSGRYSTAKALDALEALAAQQQVILWVDHLEAPRLTPRHPLDVSRLMWGVREIGQRVRGLQMVFSGREAMEAEALGVESAFHQQGKWLTIDNPSIEAWREVAERLGLSAAVAGILAEMTDGHPATMQLALQYLGEQDSLRDPDQVLRVLTARDDGLAARAMQHARTLHRLGGQVMVQIAYGQPPYGMDQRGRSPSQEIRKVLEKLRLAGLVRRGRPRWRIVNPLVAFRLRGSVQLLSGSDW